MDYYITQPNLAEKTARFLSMKFPEFKYGYVMKSRTYLKLLYADLQGQVKQYF